MPCVTPGLSRDWIEYEEEKTKDFEKDFTQYTVNKSPSKNNVDESQCVIKDLKKKNKTKTKWNFASLEMNTIHLHYQVWGKDESSSPDMIMTNVAGFEVR